MQLMQDFGWTLEQVGDLTMMDVEFIALGWKKNPPLAAMVAGFLGVGREERPRRATRADMAELAKFMGT